jgi:hypothetical protein
LEGAPESGVVSRRPANDHPSPEGSEEVRGDPVWEADYDPGITSIRFEPVCGRPAFRADPGHRPQVHTSWRGTARPWPTPAATDQARAVRAVSASVDRTRRFSPADSGARWPAIAPSCTSPVRVSAVCSLLLLWRSLLQSCAELVCQIARAFDRQPLGRVSKICEQPAGNSRIADWGTKEFEEKPISCPTAERAKMATRSSRDPAR